jgi:hypothetical protein
MPLRATSLSLTVTEDLVNHIHWKVDTLVPVTCSHCHFLCISSVLVCKMSWKFSRHIYRRNFWAKQVRRINHKNKNVIQFNEVHNNTQSVTYTTEFKLLQHVSTIFVIVREIIFGPQKMSLQEFTLVSVLKLTLCFIELNVCINV